MCSNKYPCDIPDMNGNFTCPFAEPNSCTGMYFCRDHCGLGVSEEEPDIEEPEIDESMNPYDGTFDWENDVERL